MLVSRIKEEHLKHSWKDAVANGVALTGGVISSAGIILAATFAVLITQPLAELYLFGIIMALGVIMDTFLVRGMLLPAILILVNKKEKSSAVSINNSIS
jgi:RND superfamily putative drug exporter